MDIQNLVPIEWAGCRVLLTSQLAEAYGCTVKNISDNFNRAKEYFKEGVHYFCLTGTVLEQFKNCSENFGTVGARTRILYLWTYQGCVRHCKMINTSRAWDMFDKLEQNYFQQLVPVIATKPVQPAHVPNPNRRAGQFKDARLYVSEVSDGTVKVGQSCDVETRKSNIGRQYNVKLGRTYKGSYMPRKIVRLLEKAFKEEFAVLRVKGEFFSIDFEMACNAVDALEKLARHFQIESVELLAQNKTLTNHFSCAET